ncbi:MAG TPA: hypothetical protein VEO54_07015 [Thermoanaerobaculia bacterium]|nr:hypothetical protein [Thermoanaerobaculia bacterium]
MRRAVDGRIAQPQQRGAARGAHGLPREGHDAIDPFGRPSAVADRMRAEQAADAGEQEPRVVSRVMVHGIEGHPAAHLHAELRGQVADRMAERKVIGDEQQRSAAAHPRLNGLGLGRGERGRCVLLVASERRGDDEDPDLREPRRTDCFVEHVDLVAVMAQELGEGAVGAAHGVPVVMPLIDQDARSRARVRGIRDRGVVAFAARGGEQREERDETFHGSGHRMPGAAIKSLIPLAGVRRIRSEANSICTGSNSPAISYGGRAHQRSPKIHH